jgi:hypothetical protein
MPRRVLVVTPVARDPAEAERAIRAHAGEDAAIQVVVPAVGVSWLEWLMGVEDEARAAAEVTARETEAATSERTHASVGDTDPVQAVEDALATFPADELVIVTRPDEQAEWLEGGSVAEALRRFDLPIAHLVATPAGVEPAVAEERPVAERHEVARGAAEDTPVRLLNRVGALVLGAAALVIIVVFLVYLLA